MSLPKTELSKIYSSVIKQIKVDGMSTEDAMKNAYTHLAKRAEELITAFMNDK